MDDTPPLVTPDEANALVPQIQSLIEQLQGLQRSLANTQEELDTLQEKLSAGNGYPIHELREQEIKLSEHQLDLAQAFQSAAEQLVSLGCVVKDLEQGLVDFYWMREGEVVCLCWKLGEDRIRFWHRLEDGFAGRHPLP